MKRAHRDPIASKQEIIAKSAPLFNVYGFEGTSMQMLIDATGFQKGGIYRHFTSKKELAEAAFTHNYAQLRQIYLDGVYDSDSAKTQLLRLLKNFISAVGNPAIQGGCPVLNMAIEVDDTDKELGKTVKTALIDLTDIVKSVLLAGIESGEFDPLMDAHKESNFMIALIEGSIMMAKLHRKAQIILDNCDQLLRYIDQFIFIHAQTQTQKI